MVEEVTLDVEDVTGGIEDGDTVTAKVVDAGLEERGRGDETYTYYQLELEEVNTGFGPLFASWPARITRNTGLGRLVERFGVDLDGEEQVKLHEIFHEGREVDLDVTEEDSEVENDDGEMETRAFIRAVDESIRPVGEDAPEIEDEDVGEANEASTDGGDDEIRREVLDLASDHVGGPESDLKTELASEGGEHFQAFMALKEAGAITIQNGTVTNVEQEDEAEAAA